MVLHFNASKKKEEKPGYAKNRTVGSHETALFALGLGLSRLSPEENLTKLQDSKRKATAMPAVVCSLLAKS